MNVLWGSGARDRKQSSGPGPAESGAIVGVFPYLAIPGIRLLAWESLPVQQTTSMPTENALGPKDYEAVFQASPDGILVVDSRGLIRAMNPMVETLFGYSMDELMGREVEVLVPDRVRPYHAGHREAYAAEPKARPMGIGMELSARRRDGSEFPVEISLSPWMSDSEPLVIATVRDVTQRRRLRDFGASALRASEAERKRIARELHDDTAQRIAALLLRLRLVEREAEARGVSLGLEGFREELAACGEGVRRIARGLRPPELEDAGVVAALRAYARVLRDGNGLNVEVEADAVDDLLDASSRLVLYRIVQEALSNVVRHSGSTSAQVSVRRAESEIRVEVIDQGRGFAEGTASTTLGGGLGLLGMQERAAGAGGRVEVASQMGQGTRVTFVLPITTPVPTDDTRER
jgi:two-component system sensor kinase FixL